MPDHLTPQHTSVPLSPSREAVLALLTDAVPLLGPRTPLPALYEEVLRAWRGASVGTARFRQAQALLDRINALPAGTAALADLIADGGQPEEVRLLAATLWAHARPAANDLPFPEALPTTGNDLAWAIPAMACLTLPDTAGRYPSLLEHLLTREQSELQSPEVLPLLAFLKGMCDDTLTPAQFDACVLQAHVLHPEVAAHHPLRQLHRLLDYLELSSETRVRQAYRQLTARIWPQATPENWPLWQWVTTPGGPETFPRALQAVSAGECTIMRFHELRYAPLPPAAPLRELLAGLEPAMLLLLCWLRPALRREMTGWPQLDAALRWMTGSNQAAAAEAYAAPAWWDAWRDNGLPAAREALRRLLAAAVPPAPAGRHGWREDWLERYLAPDFRRICANLQLMQGAAGESAAELCALAADGAIPALRALALLPEPGEEVLALLRRQAKHGGRPVQAAATAALDHLARRRGLPGAAELDRQHLLAVAWEAGPLDGERVRVGWDEGNYRLRLSLEAGKVQLDVLGPRGPVARIPAELRQSDAYRQARAAQRDTQETYRLFKQRLEQYMLDETPFTGGEFRYLLSNPVFSHLAERLLWQTAHGDVVLWAGPNRWETLDGQVADLSRADDGTPLTLTVVHPVTLARVDRLAAWQMLAADRRLVQPFKQLFREIYLAEGESGRESERFAGRRIHPQRAYAVLRAAGFAPGNGVARREWPGGVTAHLCWAEGARGRDLFGPHRKADVLSGAIWFTRQGERLPLAQVERIAFSETLRTADLLTSRAAAGDAEMDSRETSALRASLVRQVARSFRLTNIAMPEAGQYALVLGARATYRVNLASGTVLLEPEGRQIVLPAHDARWRPTEDGDATTEVLAIILTLAHDEEIADLTFLAQLPVSAGPVR